MKTNKEIYNSLQEIKDMEDMIRELQTAVKVKKDLLKAEMTADNITEVIAGDRVAKLTTSLTTRLDTKRIKAEWPDMYNEFSTTKEEYRLTIK